MMQIIKDNPTGYSFTLITFMVLKQLKIEVQLFCLLNPNFLKFNGLITIFPSSPGPWPQLQKDRESL